MLKLTRLDHRTVAINPDHIAWVEANPDTTLCLLGDRKIIVRESLEEVCERFVAARARMGCGNPVIVPNSSMAPRRSQRPSGSFSRTISSFPAPSIVDDPTEYPYRGSYPPRKDGE